MKVLFSMFASNTDCTYEIALAPDSVSSSQDINAHGLSRWHAVHGGTRSAPNV